MREFTQRVDLQMPIWNLYRKNHVLIFLRTPEGKYILGEKKGFYPVGISRMFGGGIKEWEDPIIAAQREIQEETQMDIWIQKFIPLCKIETQAKTMEWAMAMNTYVYYTAVHVSEVTPSDDVNGMTLLDEGEFQDLISNMYGLSGKFETDSFWFDWSDWWAIYGYIHERAYECFLECTNEICTTKQVLNRK